MLCIVLFSGSLCEISFALTWKLLRQHIHLIPCQKLCPLCVSIQEIIETEHSEENNDECNSDGEDDDINDLEQTFTMLEKQCYLHNTLEEIDIGPVKLHVVPQHLQLVMGTQKLEKNWNIFEEKHTKLKSNVAHTLKINEDNLSDDKPCV